MSFAPVFLDEPLENRAAMTFLRHANQCPRAGFLYQKHRRRGVQTVAMMRGSAGHAVFERGTKAMLETGNVAVPPELVKAIAQEVFEEFPVPVEEHDYLREQAYRWGEQFRLREDEEVVAVERLFVLEVDGWQVRCRVDFASKDAGNRLYVLDYKTGRGAPNYDDVTRKRPDGSLAAKAFQLIVYTLTIALGRPVEVRDCPNCIDGSVAVGVPPSMWQSDEIAPEPQQEPCETCGARGYVEVVGEQVARGCPEAIMEYVYPGIEDGEGRMLRRTMGLTRVELLEYLESLRALLKRVERYEQMGEWPAVVSDAACDECPCPAECPIPAELRDHHGSINTPEQVVEALQKRHVRQKRDRALGREIRGFVDKVMGGGPVFYGNRVAEIVPREQTEVKDRDGLIEALAGGMDPVEARAKFLKTSKGTTFSERDRAPEEYTNNGQEADDAERG